VSARGVAARAAVALAALVALGWLAIQYRNEQLRQSALVSASRGDVATADDDLRRSELLNSDETPEIERALIRAGKGDVPGAVSRLRAVVRREPDNLTAWGDLLVLADDAKLRDVAAVATVEVKRLNPLTASRAASSPLAH
jgi:hypothetical protein